MKKNLPEGSFPFHRGISFGDKRKCPGRADLGAKGLTMTEVTRHGPFGHRVKRWRTIRTSINTGFAPDASFLIRHYRIGCGDALSGACRTDVHARGLFAVLTGDGYEDRDLFPLLHPYSRKGRAAGAFMGEAAYHFTGLTSCTAFGNDGDGAHLDNLYGSFFTMNIQFKSILTYNSYLSSIFLIMI
jgi:hypothetical protein